LRENYYLNWQKHLLVFLLNILALCGITFAQKPLPYLPTKLANDNLIGDLLEIKADEFKTILSNPRKYEIQIIYTQINHKENGQAELIQHQYQLNPKQYFYPASLVKLPLSVLALEKCNQLNIPSDAPMITLANHHCQKQVSIDSSAINYKPSIANYVKKMMLVSDNDAYSRVFEFMGADAIKKRLLTLDIKNTDILHRFDPGCNALDNLFYNPMVFLNENGDTIYKQAASKSVIYQNYHYVKKTKGKAHYNARGKLIRKPKVFTQNNVMPLQEINDFLIALMYPQFVPKEKQIQLKDEDYKMLLKAMSRYPRESDYPHYDGSKFEDSYKKYLMLGDYHDTIKTDSLRIFNVVGQSYGWLADCAYFVDHKNKVDFFLSAVIYVNSNQVLNDGRYEYKQIGFPFLTQLGKLIYEYERTRKREYYGSFERFTKLN
jgi:hypothetical protein